MPRYFTLQQATRMLPEVDQLLRDALFHKAEYQVVNRELDEKMRKIRMSGGARVSPGPILELRARRDRHAENLRETFQKVEDLGILIKDLDIGLIDFLTLYHGQEVCLCWKLGEEGITFWHGTEEGFRGRKAIDEEFLANHKGDAAN
jgi:hypothetical protein